MQSPAGAISAAGRVFAWSGALLFAAAIGYFLITYALTFGESQQGRPSVRAIAWNVALFTVFALHHSLFARLRVREVIARHVPPDLERSCYVWVASLLFAGVCALWRPVAGTAWIVPRPFGVLAYLVMAVGVSLTLLSARVIDVFELAGVRRSTAAEFKVSGPYGLVRHPIYLGWFLMVFGVPVMTGTRLVFALASCAYLLIAIPFEERSLRRTTGGKYDEYIRRVPWKLVPGLY